MSLREFSLESIRPIFRFCDLESLVRLYATFDSRIQKLLRSRLAIPVLDLGLLKTLPRGPTRYLVRALQDVERLELPDNAEWSPSSLSLLSSLNPYELSFGANLLHPSVKLLSRDAVTRPEDPAIGRLMQMMKPVGFPHLPSLTSHLHTLNITCELNSVWSDPISFSRIELPPSITCLTLPLTPLSESDIKTLSSGLIALSLSKTSVDGLYAIFGRFASLESLSLSCPQEPTDDEVMRHRFVEAPSSLTNLQIKSGSFPSFLFNGIAFHPCVRLSRIGIDCKMLIERHEDPDAELDFSASVWPVALRSLSLSAQFASILATSITLPRLPHSLTELEVIGSQRLLAEAMAPLPSSLSKLTVVDLWNRHAPFTRNELPSSITWLKLALDRGLEASDFEVLPATLVELHTSKFDLTRLEALRTRSPNCHLHIMDLIFLDILWENGLFLLPKFAALVSPALDLVALHHALDLYGVSEKLNLEVSIQSIAQFALSTSTLKYRPLSPSNTLRGHSVVINSIHSLIERALLLPDFTEIDVDGVTLALDDFFFRSSLTRMDLGNCHISLNTLPSTLTHLTSSSIVDVTSLRPDTMMPNFVVLDAPNWTFPANYFLLCTLDSCTVLRCKIAKMRDIDVVPFLTSKVSGKTRLNMSVSISVFVTGTLIDREALIGLKDLDYDTAKRLTSDKLHLALGSPMPMDEHGSSAMTVADGLKTIDAVLNSLSFADSCRRGWSLVQSKLRSRPTHSSDHPQLGRLPLEAFRSILEYCNLASIVRLNASGDARIQKLVRSRRAVTILDLSTLKSLQGRPLRYLLHKLRDVHRLVLPNDAQWEASSLPLLASLNPTEVSFGALFMPQSTMDLAKLYSASPHDSILGRWRVMMQPFGFPNLRLLLPNLRTLEFRSYLHENHVMSLRLVSLPPTITSLSMPRDYCTGSDVDWLPRSLVQLTLGEISAADLINILGRLRALESISFEAPKRDTTPGSPSTLNVPSLTQLQVTCAGVPSAVFEAGLLLRSSNLKVIYKCTKEKFELPDEMLANLPHNLSQLHVAVFNLAKLPLLRQHAPNCHVHIMNPSRLHMYASNGPLFLQKLTALIAPEMDVVALHRALDLYGVSEKVKFKIDLEFEDVVGFNPTTFRCHLRDGPALSLRGAAATINLGALLSKVVRIPSLQRLDLDAQLTLNLITSLGSITRMYLGRCNVKVSSLPASLTHLTSSATVNASDMMFTPSYVPKFSVLDTPKWIFMASYLQETTENCFIFKCTALIHDYDLVLLLEQTASRQDCNTSVSAVVCITGSMVEGQCDPTDLKTARRLTIPKLEQILETANSTRNVPGAVESLPPILRSIKYVIPGDLETLVDED